MLYIAKITGEPKIGNPSIPNPPNFGIKSKTFPPNKDMILKNDVKILPIKKKFNRLRRCFFVDKKLRVTKVSNKTDPNPNKPPLNL